MIPDTIEPVKIAPAEADVACKPRVLYAGCPLCESDNVVGLRVSDCSAHPLYHPIISGTINWMRCNQCAHVFTDGFFSDEVCEVLFGKIHEYQKPGWAFEQQRAVSARMIERVARYVDGGAWLDVGFGNGSLLFTAEEWGYIPVGLDLRPSCVEIMKKIGIESHCIDIAAFEGVDRFSVISMADVLEHMPFPRVGLAAAHRLLRPDGILFLSMPNYNCMVWRLLDAANANPYWGELEHFHNFSRVRLYDLAREMGFEPICYGVSERNRSCMEVVLRRA